MPDTLVRLKAALADRYAIDEEIGSGDDFARSSRR